jgi:hypothetical protein
MRRTKQVIAVVMVATALCADRATLAAAPATPRSETNAGLARTFASRLTSNLRRAVAPSLATIEPVRSDEKVQAFALPIHEEARGVRSEFSPFQFRLPPPIC